MIELGFDKTFIKAQIDMNDLEKTNPKIIKIIFI